MKRTPRSRSPLVTPVADDDHVALRELVLRDAVRPRPPHPACARPRSEKRLVGQSCACIPPPRQRSAAAVRIAWRVPPIPIARWSFVPRTAAEMAAVTVPSPISLMRVPAPPQLLDQVLVPRPVEHERRDVERLPVEALGHRADVLGHGQVEVDHRARTRADRDPCACTCPEAGRSAPSGATASIAIAPTPPRATTAAPLDRVECEIDAIRHPLPTLPVGRSASPVRAPITIWPSIGISSSAAFIPFAAASSAASSSARPSQRAPASAAHSVARAYRVQRQSATPRRRARPVRGGEHEVEHLAHRLVERGCS